MNKDVLLLEWYGERKYMCKGYSDAGGVKGRGYGDGGV